MVNNLPRSKTALTCYPGKTKLKLGSYELASGPTNDWHYVEISRKGRRKYRWTNRAGVSWTLARTRKKDTLKVGKDCPYYNHGYTRAVFNSTGISGPWDAFYRLLGGKLSSGEIQLILS